MGLFGGSSSNHTCPSITTGPQYGADHVLGSFTFHDLTTVLCAAFAGATFMISGISLLLHATHFSNPAEQVKILRIIAIVPAFAFVYFLAGAIPSAAIYLQPWSDFYEAIALTSYFLLLVTYLVPTPEHRYAYFDRLRHKSGGSSLAWYRRTWVFVFQYIVFSFIVAAATDITQAVGVFCDNGKGVHFAHTWLTVIRSISVALAFIRLLGFYQRTKSELIEHHVLSKLAAIKGVVLVTFIQSIIFTILKSTSAVKPSSKLSYNDIYYGIPSILICGEMILFALFQFYAYSARPYFKRNTTSAAESLPTQNMRYYGGFLGTKALLAALNPLEILGGLIQAVGYLVSNPSTQRYDTARALEPLRYGQASGSTDMPPPYASTNAKHQAVTAPERAYSPNDMEHGTVDEYTPLPRSQF